MEGKPIATEEQQRYATVLDIGMKIGLLFMVVIFILYLIGVPKPQVPVDEVSGYWDMKVDKYLEATGIEKGWSWAGKLGKSDFLNFASITFLAAVTAFCYLTVIPIFLKKKDRVYALLAILEIMVLVLAASGVLPSGGH